jgi:nitroreductase
MSPTAASIDATALETLVSAAIAAPSMHNTQPWLFRLAPDSRTVEIHAAADRSLHHEDPHGRALHLSAGAALFNLRLAVANFGWNAIFRLLPDPHRPGVLATAQIAGNGTGTVHRRDLYDAIWRRHSSRFPFTGRPVPTDVLHELTDAAHSEGAHLILPTLEETTRLLQITTQAERRSHHDPDRGGESRRWTSPSYGPGTRDDSRYIGIPSDARGTQDASETVPMRDFTAQRHQERLPAQAFEQVPTIAVLHTDHDRRIDWLRAGQSMQHVLLVATANGLRTSLLHQAMEWPDLRAHLRTPQAPRGHAQMLIRLGYGPQGPETPRYPARRLLQSDGSPSPCPE